MSSREQYKELHKQQRAVIKDLNTSIGKLKLELEKANNDLYTLGARLHLLRYTPWWKIWKLIKLILKLRQS